MLNSEFNLYIKKDIKSRLLKIVLINKIKFFKNKKFLI